jgi:hypothetical protein
MRIEGRTTGFKKMAACLSATLLLLVASPAIAQDGPRGTLDASNLGGTPSTLYQGNFFSYLWWAQTFVAGRSGALVSAQATLFKFTIGDPPTQPFDMEIRRVDDHGAPWGPPLASTTIPASAVTSMGPIPGSLVTGIFDQAAEVTAGERYALVLSTRSPASYAISFDELNRYEEGQVWLQFDPLGQFGPPYAWTSTGFDMIFATYIEDAVPFSTFTPSVTIHRALGIEESLRFEARLALGDTTNGIDPAAEGLTLSLNDYVLRVPPKAIRQRAPGTYLYTGPMGEMPGVVSIAAVGDDAYKVLIKASDSDLKQIANPVDVSLAIGDDNGSQRLTAKVLGPVAEQ